MAMTAPYQGQLKFELLQSALRAEMLSSGGGCGAESNWSRQRGTEAFCEAPATRVDMDLDQRQAGKNLQGGAASHSDVDCNIMLSSYIASFGIMGTSSVAEGAAVSPDAKLPRHDDHEEVSRQTPDSKSCRAKSGASAKSKRKRGISYRGLACFRPLSEEEKAAWFGDNMDEVECRDVGCAPRGNALYDGACSSGEQKCDAGGSTQGSQTWEFVPMPPLIEDSLEGGEVLVCEAGLDVQMGSVESEADFGGDLESGETELEELALGEVESDDEPTLPNGRVYDLPVTLTTVKARLHKKELHNQGPPLTKKRDFTGLTSRVQWRS